MRALTARGHRFYHESSALLTHVNAVGLGGWLRERFLSGMYIASSRKAEWSMLRTAAYALASPLIPAIVFSRTIQATKAAGRSARLPAGTRRIMVVATLVSATGELFGYVGAYGPRLERAATALELHKTTRD